MTLLFASMTALQSVYATLITSSFGRILLKVIRLSDFNRIIWMTRTLQLQAGTEIIILPQDIDDFLPHWDMD